MKKLYDFEFFLESKKEGESSEVKNEVRKIVSEMFAIGKNIQFSGNQDGEPKFVQFEVDKTDYNLNYGKEDLFIEYSKNILKKRQFRVSLKFDSKSIEDGVYKIRFQINLTPTSEIKFEKNIIGWSFEEFPKKVTMFLKDVHQKYKWNEDENILTMDRSKFDKMEDRDYLKTLIDDEGGVKIRIK
jgi:hypothetical protein